jgi:transposase
MVLAKMKGAPVSSTRRFPEPRQPLLPCAPSTSLHQQTVKREQHTISFMAPRLAASQHQLIGDMILSGSLKQADMAAVAGCSERSIRAIASNLRHFGKTKAPPISVGRRRRITPQMLDALFEHLLEKPGLYQDEMAVFLYDEFGIHVTIPSISRALKSIGWTKKVIRQVA